MLNTVPIIQHPSNNAKHKSQTTVKDLLSIDLFTEVFNFVSQEFSGNSSDQQLSIALEARLAYSC